MITEAFAAFNAASKIVKVGSVVVALLGLLTAGGVVYHGIWKRGYDHALKDVAAEDAEAIDRANDYRGSFLDCRSRGLRWDTSAGKCSGG